MTHVLLLATTTGYQIRSFGEAAARLGVRLLFASDRCDRLDDPWWDGAVPVRFHDEAASLARVTRAVRCGDIPAPGGVLAVGDRPTPLAASIAAALGLPGNPPEAARRSRNKLESHAAFLAAGLPMPTFTAITLRDDAAGLAARLAYPVVLKPLALSGSRGVMRADDAEGFLAACDRLRRILAAPDVRLERDDVHELALVESFIAGREYAVEGVLTGGRLQVFAVFDKPDPLDGPVFEETIYVTPSRASAAEQQAIAGAVDRAAAALGLRHGPLHAECRLAPDGRVYVLEVAARPIGGLCARALHFAGGASLEEVLLRHALGEDVSRCAREAQASGVMMIPIPRRGVLRDVRGVEAAGAVAGVEEVRITATRDATLVPLPEGRSYLGFIFARGATAAEVERALREAHGRLEFAIETAIPVI